MGKSTHVPVSGKQLVARSVRLLFILLSGLFALSVTAPANAEISSEVEFKTDDRFRGRSLSGGEPVIDADISVDLASGLYAGGSATFILAGKDRAGFQAVDAFVGYATRVDENITFDVGVAGYAFTKRYSGNAPDRYTEIYTGVSSGGIAAYIHYTPNYFDKGVPALYVDLNFTRPIGSDYSIKAHAGLLAQTSGPARLGGRSARFDTRIAVSRPILGLEAEIAWTYAGPDDLYFGGPWDGNSAVTFSLAKHF